MGHEECNPLRSLWATTDPSAGEISERARPAGSPYLFCRFEIDVETSALADSVGNPTTKRLPSVVIA
jgi:hypothetical protein